jgi:hypothetical protein
VWLYTGKNAAYHGSSEVSVLHRGQPVCIVVVRRAAIPGAIILHTVGRTRKQKQAIVWTPDPIPPAAVVKILPVDRFYFESAIYKHWAGLIRKGITRNS